MKISFDLDDTLIIPNKCSPIEKVIKFPYTIWFKERLRKGLIQLYKDLLLLNYEICVYTTSERSKSYINKLFKLHGIKLSKIINLNTHIELVQGNRKEIMPSKVPSKFGIDLHIDDDISVKQNGIQYGYNVLIINPDDLNWTNKVLEEAKRIKRMREASHST